MNLHKAYGYQKTNAKRRGIDWEFTYESWLSTWEKSGHLEHRGRGVGKYAMARFGDSGPYSPSNVEIITHEKNASDCRKNHPISFLEHAQKNLGRGKGFSFRKGAYQVIVSHKYIGLYRTKQLAEAAYKNAVEQRIQQIIGADVGLSRKVGA
jgi:hypothetical protein